MFLPTKTAARNALNAFLPKSGSLYAAERNYDNGPGEDSSVSRLSPWIRTRILPEWEVVGQVLQCHSESAASKFIDEVCWRTYWKGWLQLRPSVWDSYLAERNKLIREFKKNIGYGEAIEGRTGIDCFDAWNTQLTETNYLHNHARMWYASIWIHTLKLPWQLGADWFYRHLLDGDAASNTLSWRWVAGLHTRGKTYLARPDNIRKYTSERFEVTARLAKEPVVLEELNLPKPRELQPNRNVPQDCRIGLLITEEDLSAFDWLGEQTDFVERAAFFSAASYKALDIVSEVVHFRRQSLRSIVQNPLLEETAQIAEWAKACKLDSIVMAEPKAGMDQASFNQIKSCLSESSIGLYTVRHWWDDTLYPNATHGFFRFKQAIPFALDRLRSSPLRQTAS